MIGVPSSHNVLVFVRVNRIDIYRLADGVYYVDLDFTRYNTSDEILFEGRTLYFFGNETGSWKMFAAAPVQRDL